jgi:hypothetical protein
MTYLTIREGLANSTTCTVLGVHYSTVPTILSTTGTSSTSLIEIFTNEQMFPYKLQGTYSTSQSAEPKLLIVTSTSTGDQSTDLYSVYSTVPKNCCTYKSFEVNHTFIMYRKID